MLSAIFRLLVLVPMCAFVLATPLLVSADISNPVAHWTFDEASGTTAADASGNGNTVTLANGATWTTGNIGGAVSFDGVNDSLSAADSASLDIGNTFTQTFWVKRTGGLGVQQVLLSKGVNTSVPIFGTNNLVTWCFHNLGCPFSSAIAITDTNFHHIALVKNGATASIYIDGQLSNSVSNAPTTANNAYGLCIGSDNNAGACSSSYFTGVLDDVYVYNRALSADDVAQLFQLGTPAAAPTVTMTASPTSVATGQSSTLTWSSTNATSCALSGGYTATVGTSGTQVVTPSASGANYNITCTGAGGSANATAIVTNSGTTPPPSDTAAPSTPTNLTATAISSSQINLSWTASTDNVGVTGYQVFRNGVQVGSPTGTNVIDTGLSASTAYSYTVRAIDAAGNISQYSATVSATTQAAPALPSAPAVTFFASPASIVSGQSTTLTWSSSDATSCTASGGWNGTKSTSGSESVTPVGSNISYTLSCTGPGGSASVSTIVTVSSPSVPNTDTQAPSTPINLAITAASASQISLSWTASTDNVGVTGYQVFRNGVQVGSPTGTSFTDTGLAASTAYNYSVKGIDAAANTSADSSTARAMTQAAPALPSAPAVTFFASPASIVSGQSTTLTWSSSDATSCAASGGWNGTRATSGSESVTPIASNTSYTITCIGTGGSASVSTIVTVSSPSVPNTDTQAPSAPINLATSAASAAQINFSWSPATDNVGVTSYQVFRNGVQVGSPSGTSFTDTGLAASTAYSYTVRAIDAAGNISAYSSAVSATTLSSSGTTGGGSTVYITLNAPSGGGAGTPDYSNSNLPITATTSVPVPFVAGIAGRESATIGGSTASASTLPLFTRTMSLGDKGDDIRNLQIFLNTHGFPVASSGLGSPGNESTEFGAKTEAALIRFQKANAVAMNLVEFTGLFGETTRSYVNTILLNSPTNVPTTPSAETDRAAKIAVLLKEVARLQAILNQLKSGMTSIASQSTLSLNSFDRGLELDMTGEDVRALQVILNKNGYSVADSGPGSSGNETTSFGMRTFRALSKFQAAHGLPSTGYFGPLTRQLISGMIMQQ